MPSVITTEMTLYSIEPRVFFKKGMTSFQAATNPLYTDVTKLRKGSVVVDCWVDITTQSGAAGADGELRLTNGVDPTAAAAFTLIDAINVNATGMTPGPGTLNQGPLTADGMLVFKKDGAGTALVITIFAMFIRPNMNP